MSLKVKKTTSEGFRLHEEDEWYAGDLVDMEETSSQWGDGLKWIIELDDDEPDDDGNPRETWAYCSQVLSPRSKLWGWVKAIDASLLPEEDGDVLDLELILGGRVEVMFERYDDMDDAGEKIEKEKVVKIRAEKTEKRRRRRTRDEDEPEERAPRQRSIEDDDDEDEVSSRRRRRSKRDDYGPDEAPF